MARRWLHPQTLPSLFLGARSLRIQETQGEALWGIGFRRSVSQETRLSGIYFFIVFEGEETDTTCWKSYVEGGCLIPRELNGTRLGPPHATQGRCFPRE